MTEKSAKAGQFCDDPSTLPNSPNRKTESNSEINSATFWCVLDFLLCHLTTIQEQLTLASKHSGQRAVGSF